MAQHSIILISKNQLTRDMLELHFTKPNPFLYTAGQFVQFLVPTQDSFSPRSYSLCSIPADDHLAFCAKILPDGVASTFFSHINEGEEIAIRGPLGRFVLQPYPAYEFVATGAGIAPIMGMIQDLLLQHHTQVPLHLTFGVRYREDVFWIHRLDDLAKQYSNFSYTLTLSRPDEQWQGARGHVTEHIHVTNTLDAGWYVCGSPDMVKDVKATLLTSHIPTTQIHFEIF